LADKQELRNKLVYLSVMNVKLWLMRTA